MFNNTHKNYLNNIHTKHMKFNILYSVKKDVEIPAISSTNMTLIQHMKTCIRILNRKK